MPETNLFRAVLLVNQVKGAGDRGVNPQLVKVEVTAESLDDLKDKVKKHVALI